MRDAPRQLANRFHALGLTELSLHLLSPCDVNDGTRNQNPFLCDEGSQTDFRRKLGSVLPAREQFHSHSHGPQVRLLHVAGTVPLMRTTKALGHECLDGNAAEPT